MSEAKKDIVHRPRASACADASLRARLEQIEAMSIEERIKAALSLDEKFAWLKPVRRKEP